MADPLPQYKYFDFRLTSSLRLEVKLILSQHLLLIGRDRSCIPLRQRQLISLIRC